MKKKKKGFFKKLLPGNIKSIEKKRREQAQSGKSKELQGNKVIISLPDYVPSYYQKQYNTPATDTERLDYIQLQIDDLLKRYNIEEKGVWKEITPSDSISDLKPEMSPEEVETAAKKLQEEHDSNPEISDENHPLVEKRKERIKQLADQLERHKIITDFDRILDAIEKQGKLNSGKLMEELGIEKERFKEIWGVLEHSGAIKVEYPLFGAPKLVSINYIKLKSKKKKEDYEE